MYASTTPCIGRLEGMTFGDLAPKPRRLCRVACEQPSCNQLFFTHALAHPWMRIYEFVVGIYLWEMVLGVLASRPPLRVLRLESSLDTLGFWLGRLAPFPSRLAAFHLSWWPRTGIATRPQRVLAGPVPLGVVAVGLAGLSPPLAFHVGVFSAGFRLGLGGFLEGQNMALVLCCVFFGRLGLGGLLEGQKICTFCWS